MRIAESLITYSRSVLVLLAVILNTAQPLFQSLPQDDAFSARAHNYLLTVTGGGFSCETHGVDKGIAVELVVALRWRGLLVTGVLMQKVLPEWQQQRSAPEASTRELAGE